MRAVAALLVFALAVAGLWGPDSLANAQSDCTSQGAVAAGQTALAADCELLLDIRDTLAGTATLNWAADVPIGRWQGVAIGGTPLRVRYIYLDSRELTGTIPSELGNISTLRRLDLGGNRLSGEIPPEQGGLSNLELLDLGENQLTGPIPRELANLSRLKRLNLRWNELSGQIPTELGGLSDLEWLGLDVNRLTGEIPVELSGLSDLTYMKLGGNELDGSIPPEFGNLNSLTSLRLWGNQLAGEIPHSLTGLAFVKYLSFYSNAGLCAPIDKTFQTWLRDVDTVQGSSCAPQDSQGDKAVLAKIYDATGGANWYDNSNWLSNRRIREWHGVTNDANGRITGLFLAGNWLTGSIPPELGDLSNLESLHLHFNQLSGTIPTELGNLSELRWLNLGDNQLTGTIPLELGRLSKLERLYLAGNQFTGCLPNALQDIELNDFHDVSLPFCGEVPKVSTATEGTVVVRLHAPIPVTATFSEPVYGFTDSDVTVANGDVSNFSGSDGDSVYTFDVIPNAIGVVTADIAAGVAQDTDSDVNTAAEQLALGLSYDEDHDGAISGTEVLNAVRDYFLGTLSAEHVLDVVRLYSLPSS